MSFVLGTAGHVDHGKSVLVQALTGIDPDRLREEKERGMTIDLGFAWLELPSGRAVSIVDVPGHEHFIKNMLAGVGGIDVALLVVAADEGVMPQTREHLAILDLLQVGRGIAVIAKKDLVDEELLELVILEVTEVLAGTTLVQAPIIAVSALTGEGLPELVTTIDQVLDSAMPKKDIGRPRLPIDRVFTMAGFGTVVTGTLIDGSLSQGQEVDILPPALTARIRGLQSHKQKIDIVSPGSRVAANLSGVATGELKRGDVVTTHGWLHPTKALDVKLRVLPSAPYDLVHNTTVTLYTGATEVQAKLRLLDANKVEPGRTAFAQLALEHPIVAVKDDLFIVRSPKETLGGGQIVDARARRHRRFHSATIESLAARERGTAEEVILATLEQKRPLDMSKLVASCNLPAREAEGAIKSLAAQGEVVVLGDKGRQILFSAPGWENLAQQAKQAVQEYHRQYPTRQGMPKEELKGKLKVPANSFASALEQLVVDGTLVGAGLVLRLPDYRIQLSGEQQAVVDAFLEALARHPYAPPGELRLEPDLQNMLVQQRRVIRVSDDVIFLASVYDEMVEALITRMKSQGKITVAEVRDMFQTSRKYALALMEYLDEQKITRRVGDERVLR
jgi:selenocysteine-specific elongation factor